jgi:hypothetical protein
MAGTAQTHKTPQWGIVKLANQAGFLPNGLTPSVDGRPKVPRRCATELSPQFCKLKSVAADASRISPIVFILAALSAFRILVENRTFSMGVSSGSSGAGCSIGPATASRAKRSAPQAFTVCMERLLSLFVICDRLFCFATS